MGNEQMTALETVKLFVEAINSGDADKMAELMTEDHTFIDGDGSEHSGRSQMHSGWKEHLALIPDFTITVEDSFSRGDTVILIGTVEGTFIDKGELRPENHWRVFAAWRVKVARDKVAVWQLFANQEPLVEIYTRLHQK